jgi:hypothetical protein
MKPEGSCHVHNSLPTSKLCADSNTAQIKNECGGKQDKKGKYIVKNFKIYTTKNIIWDSRITNNQKETK